MRHFAENFPSRCGRKIAPAVRIGIGDLNRSRDICVIGQAIFSNHNAGA